MRTAEEILNSVLDGAAVLHKSDALTAINEARKEAIEECAKVVEHNKLHFYYSIDKNDILDLIKKIN